MKLSFFKFLGRTGLDAKLFALGTEKELQQMLNERRKAQVLAAQQKERLIQLQKQVDN